MVEKHLVAGSHAVAHEVARLVIAHAVPGFLLLALQLVDRERVRFGLHKPVVPAFASGLQSISSRSVATKSRGKSHVFSSTCGHSWHAKPAERVVGTEMIRTG